MDCSLFPTYFESFKFHETSKTDTLHMDSPFFVPEMSVLAKGSVGTFLEIVVVLMRYYPPAFGDFIASLVTKDLCDLVA